MNVMPESVERLVAESNGLLKFGDQVEQMSVRQRVESIRQSIIKSPEAAAKWLSDMVEADPRRASRCGLSDEMITHCCGMAWNVPSGDVVHEITMRARSRINQVARLCGVRIATAQ